MSLARGVELFNSQLYWEAHEAWEEAWLADRYGPERGFFKGLIQVAAGCLHYRRHNRRGSLNKWRSGADLLRDYPADHQGIALGELVARVDRLADSLAGSDGGWPDLEMPPIRPASGREGNAAPARSR